MFQLQRRRLTPILMVVSLLCAGLLGLTLWGVYTLTYRTALQELSQDVRTRAQLRAAVLQSELDRQRAVPVILADDSDVTAALRTDDAERNRRVSQKLERLRAETRSAVIYVVDPSGKAVSASNWALPVSFVGTDYSFRPYFREALEKGAGSQFALGTVSHKAGLYLAHAVRDGDTTLGVVVVKMDFDAIEAGWTGLPEETYVTGPAGEVFLTAHPARRFLPPTPLKADQFDTTLDVPVAGWKLHVISPDASARDTARSLTLTAALGLGLILTLLAWQWRRRERRRTLAAREAEYRERLEHDVAARTEALSDTNARLSEEIRERRGTERRLSGLQADLVQANKLASLGQITAGVAHEINQPVATIRVLADTTTRLLSEKRPARGMIEENLDRIARMCERIGHITGELRTFSRKASGVVEPVALDETIVSSILLNESRLHEHQVRLIRDPVAPSLSVMADRVRLEQVLVNLLQNAFEALDGADDPQVRLSVSEDGDWVWLRVADNGPGLAPEVLAQLFTPFVTTKPKGLGLGLVIAHDILRDFGGALSAESGSDGATFILKLRKAR